MIFRDFCYQDALALKKICENELGYRSTLKQIEENMKFVAKDVNEKIIVCEINGMVVGFIHAQIYQVLFEERMVNIMSLAVERHYHRQGIGHKLVDMIEKWATELDIHQMRVVSQVKRKEAHLFYEKCGYNEEKIQKNFRKRFV